jgi:diadenylate cyclase
MQEILDNIVSYLYRIATYDPVVVAVELLLIGVVVWWVARFLRGTRGARMVKGLALLLASVYVIIRLLPRFGGGTAGWQRIEFLYGKFLLFVFVAFVVAFQPELRRALIQIGQTRIFRGSRGRIEAVVAALVESASFLARNKIGAVVAVERSVGLGTVMETGTPIDATVTPSLLNTIFYPGSALHDMGVIIRGDRVAAAGCQFPLAESEDVDASLGSRHRAALGLAQDSDAVVLVISEETGRVSLAYEGQLYIGLDIDNLRDMLVNLLSTQRNLAPGSSRRGR